MSPVTTPYRRRPPSPTQPILLLSVSIVPSKLRSRMVNFNDPATIALDSETVVKLWHLMDGIFIWEFFSTLDYEWDVIRGNRPHRWTIWVYSVARMTTLVAVILNMIGFNTATEINCLAWSTFLAFFSYIAYLASSLLIVLRIIAIWNKAKIIFAIAMGIWIADNGIFIYGVSQLRSAWLPEENLCTLLNVDSTKPAIIGSFFSDIALLLIMLIGLLRLRREGGGAFALGRTLWKQGLIWLLLATVAEVPSTVLMILNLNAPLNLITQSPGMIIVTIAATRLYRSLTNIYSSNISYESPRGTGRSASEPQVQPGPMPLNQMEVSVRTEYDQFPTTQMSHSGACISTNPEGSYKEHEVSLNIDVESGLEEK
ncbi:hypothetical protein DFH94DRAFT_25610 [Russula ochroleuca]|uniref:Uncharacterized protein n=1 Tax=Russula ochroleuca TaxID=152965 RepID=A0A9P5N6U6_9AGAM|nr:hypothetical protein DFH94DRAFT_25610 [Russula ochroleuca]